MLKKINLFNKQHEKKNNDDFSFLSTGKSKIVHDCLIKKLPLGSYISAIQQLSELPDRLIDDCFTGMTFGEFIDTLPSLKGNELKSAVNRMIYIIPDIFIQFIGYVIGTDAKRLIEDENIGLNGFLEIIEAFIEVNELGKCKKLLMTLIKATA